MTEIQNVGMMTAVVAGIVSFLSPCVLPLVPGYLSFVAGRSVDELQAQNTHRERILVLFASLAFVLGFSTVFVALGASASGIGRLLLTYKHQANIVGGVLIIIFGLFMSGLLNPRWLHVDTRLVHRVGMGKGPVFAYVLGLAFAFGWTPCIGPILGRILTVTASSQANVNGMALLAAYSLGLGVPFLLTALFVERFLAHMKRLRRWSRVIHLVSGAVLVLMGVAMITGQISAMSYWFLKVFPVLGRIG